MEIVLKNITLNNFQGCSDKYKFSKIINVFGANATGKTRIASAYLWLLFGKDAYGRSTFEIKNLNKEGDVKEHGIEHSVEAELEIKDGENSKTIILKKVLREKWQRTRGKAEMIFTGNAFEYYINNQKTSESGYKASINSLVRNENIFMLCSAPNFFPNLPQKEQREHLFRMIGNINAFEIIQKYDDFMPLSEYLQTYSDINEMRKYFVQEKIKFAKELDSNVVRIKTLLEMKPNLDTALTKRDCIDILESLDKSIQNNKLKLQKLTTSEYLESLYKQRALLYDKRNEITNVFERQKNEIIKQNYKIENDNSFINVKIKNLNDINSDLLAEKESITKEIDRLRDEWAKISSQEFSIEIDNICSQCGQELPQEKQEEIKNRLLSDFNIEKSNKLEKIEIEARKIKQKIDDISLKIEKNKLLVKELQEQIKPLVEIPVFDENNPDYKAIQQQIDDIEKQLQNVKNNVDEKEFENLQNEINYMQSEYNKYKEILDKFTANENIDSQIEFLKEKEKEFAENYEKFENLIILCDKFTNIKSAIYEKKINQLFEIAKFKLFKELINGSIEPVCEIMVDGVPYGAGLNDAARVQASLDIIKTMQRYYDLKVPVWINNRESVTVIPQMECQVISLIVSPLDTELRFE